MKSQRKRSTVGLPPDQSLERTRWAPAVCFAGRHLCRAAKLQIR